MQHSYRVYHADVNVAQIVIPMKKKHSQLVPKDKGLSINDVTFLGGRGVSQKVTKSDRGEGGVSQKVTILNKSYYITLHK